jgi:hypothetical protein
MSLTAYHAKLFAHELAKRSSSDNVDKLASALSDAQVDLNPHQIEAALFAFRSPLSKGAILADEVGLGKTIEAGILLAQRWAERSRKLLVICLPIYGSNGVRNPPFLDLVVEALDESGPLGLPAISVAHYGKQNGDPMRDPEMCFEVARPFGGTFSLDPFDWLC